MDIDLAKRIAGPDRVLILGLVALAMEGGDTKRVVMERLQYHCNYVLDKLSRTDDPILKLQCAETRDEVRHVLSSFRT